MNRNAAVSAIFAALLALSAPTPSRAEEGLDLELRYWTADLTGAARAGDAPLATRLDFDADLGLGFDDALGGQLTWRPTRRFFVRLDYTPLDAGGDRVVSRDVSFGGADFSLDTRIVARLDGEYGRAIVGYSLLAPSRGRLRLGPFAGAIGIRGDAMLSAPDLLDLSAREEFEAGAAIAGLALDLEPRQGVEVFADWGVSLGSDQADVTDAQAGVRYRLARHLTLSLGYRSLKITAEDGPDRLEMDLDGAFFGLGLKL